jgi:hypothetical protein
VNVLPEQKHTGSFAAGVKAIKDKQLTETPAYYTNCSFLGFLKNSLLLTG